MEYSRKRRETRAKGLDDGRRSERRGAGGGTAADRLHQRRSPPDALFPTHPADCRARDGAAGRRLWRRPRAPRRARAAPARARPAGAFGDDYGPIVALAAGMFVLYGVGSLPQGWLAARIGRKALMAAFFIGTGLSLIAAGFVSSPLLL